DDLSEHCTICIDELMDQCEAQPCRHNKFDFLCLVTWLQQRATCPLCNSRVYEVRYNLTEDEEKIKVYQVPEPSKKCVEPNEQIYEGLERSATLSLLQDSDLSNLRRAYLLHGENAVERRRFVYRHNLYSLHIGSNEHQCAASAHRELSPLLFRTTPQHISRAKVWLRRELRVFTFLNTATGLPHSRATVHRRRPGDAQYVLQNVIAILQNMDIQDSTGQAENIIQEFIGRKSAQLFLHELKAWLRSPHETLHAWDANVQYK
ncbi:hypothetical protein BDU57DRAFT_409715, partial [Ampelomyces quisqualis]